MPKMPTDEIVKTTPAGKPAFRDAIRIAGWLLQESLADNHNGAQAHGFMRSCISCDHFEESPERCKKANARPPARIIAFGCEQYSDLEDCIPF